jgi:hypothetical protein
MAIELITGVGADNHISSVDFRAFNRASFGQGRYILNDDDNMAVTVSAPTGNIAIAPGSCMWSGMHIRNVGVENLSYIVPTSSQTVYVYLHYTKNVDSGVESVSFVVSAEKTLSPIVDNMSDNTIEAYTLFYSFVANSTDASQKKYDFAFSMAHDELENLVSNAHSETVLFDGTANINSTINLSESFQNFYEIEIMCGYANESPNLCARILTSQIPSSGSFGFVAIGTEDISGSADMWLLTEMCKLAISNDKRFSVERLYMLGFANSLYEKEERPICKIIGIGRKN